MTSIFQRWMSAKHQTMRSAPPREPGQHIGDNYHGPITGGTVFVGGHGNTTVFPHDTDALLRILPGWDLGSGRFDEMKACLAGTRQQLLDDIRVWVHSADTKRILWLSGGAGTGKSSVAHSCAEFFDRHGRLGASFFFNRDIAGLNSPDLFITNLCHQLAHSDPRLKERVLSMIPTMGHIPASSLRTQARKLIVKPTTDANVAGPIVLVIDAVDEAGTIQIRTRLLDAIAEEFHNLPDSIKVIITSRDEQDIRTSLHACSDEICIEKSEKTAEDIASYIQHRFARIRRTSSLPESWPTSDKLQALYTCSERLFIWASVACSFIESGGDHSRRLAQILDLARNQKGSTPLPLSKLYALYNHILENAFPLQDEPLVDFQYVVGTIVTLEAPMTRMALDSLLGFSGDSDEDAVIMPNGHVLHLSSSTVIVNRLRPILRETIGVNGGEDRPIRLLHPSLYDYLTIHAEGNFRIELVPQHQMLATRCLHIMNGQLKFNICEMGDSSGQHKEIVDTVQYVSPGLRYACLSFVYHIAKVSESNPMLLDSLNVFVREHLLHWIEAMSLLDAVSKAEECLQTLAGWMKDQPGTDEYCRLIVCDATALLRNCGQAIRLSPLHTYYSALPLTPKTRKLFECYSSSVSGIPHIASSHPLWPSASVRILEGHTEFVYQVAFSPDGTKLASASSDCTVQLWDVESGQPIGEALTGHAKEVKHVVFSPDGKQLVSASDDRTVRFWDVESGKPIGDALKHHASVINDIAFSPDGKKFASATSDCTAWLWDVETSKLIGKPLKNHTEGVSKVVFSPDGEKLATSSDDCTVQLWDARSGELIGEALDGHYDCVNHIAFSPDGKKLASASGDNTLRLWDVERSQPIGGAIKGHTDWVNQVVFSPDGERLLSCSDDGTLRLWDVASGQPVGTALKGHTNHVKHVMFSPDGKRLASASNDCTLRVWDVESGEPCGVLKGHTKRINHAAFSPDGQKLASASNDETVRLWDVGSLQSSGELFKGHNSVVDHIVFSPDGERLATSSNDCTVQLWDARSGEPIGEALRGHSINISHLTFSPDGKKLASASADKTLRLWDVDSGQPVGGPLRGHADGVKHVAFSPDGKKLASASNDCSLRLWDAARCQPIGRVLGGHTYPANHVVFSPDGTKLASASDDCTLRLWDVESGQPIGQALKGHTSGVKTIAFSPDGTRLASASNDSTLRLWDVETGESIGEALRGHNSRVTHLVFSPDGDYLASVSFDDEFRLWDTQTGQPIRSEDAQFTRLILDGTWLQALPLSFDQQGFLQYLSKRLIWLPLTQRGMNRNIQSIAMHGSCIAIGSRSGAVTFIQWPLPFSYAGLLDNLGGGLR